LFKRDSKQTTVWRVERTGKTVTTTIGAAYGNQKQTKKRFSSPAAAIADKRQAGFRALGEIDPPSIPISRDVALESEIRKHRDDPAPYMVYADWLQGQGCAFGELLAYAQRKKPKQERAIAAKIGVPPADMATVGWRFGMWQWLKLDNTVDSMPEKDEFDPIAFARALFTSPFCAALEELRIGMLRWDYQDQADVVAEAGKQAWAQDLVRLRVGDVGEDIDMNHHAIGEIAKPISKAFPNLESLWLHSGSQDWSGPRTFEIAGLELPKLRELTIETCAMSRKRMKALAAAKLPALEHLELWFGSKDGDGNATIADVAPVWTGAFPEVRHLGLRNTELVLDIVRLLPDSKLAKQLVTLDLSKGTFGDAEAEELAAGAAKFSALTSLVVDDSWLTAAGIRTLKKAFPKAKLSAKDQQELLDPEEYGSDRYVSVSE
jgi:uncharacterized protein (TIGR02996 family)